MGRVGLFDPTGNERGGREARGVEHVAGEHGAVPARVTHVGPRQRHFDLQPRAAPVVRVEHQHAGAAGHGAQRGRETGMADPEQHPRVHRIEPVARGLRQQRRRRREHAKQQPGARHRAWSQAWRRRQAGRHAAILGRIG